MIARSSQPLPLPNASAPDPAALGRILSPASIAIIGASEDPSKRGYQAIKALREASFAGSVSGVNPRGGGTLGVEFVPSISALPDGVDVALISLPARLVPDAIRALATRRIPGAVVLANGFGEAHTEEGDALDRDLRDAIARSGVRVIGPNTSGVLNVLSGANLVGLPHVPPGPVSVVTQSGNMLLSLVADGSAHHGPGFASYVGLGNQADLRYHECLEYFATDSATGAVALHSEGLLDGRQFLRSAVTAVASKPVVMLRGGRSEVGQRAALSHTGSIAGSDPVSIAVLRQAGVELVDRSDELAVVAGVMATTQPVPDGTGVAILSDGGGHATLASDSLTARGVALATLEEDTEGRLRELLGAPAIVRNPVDVAGATDSDPSRFADAIDILMSDPNVGLVLVIGLFGGYHVRFDPALEDVEDRAAARIVEIQAHHGKPVLIQSCYGAQPIANHALLRSSGIQVLASIDMACRSVESLARRGRWLATRHQRSALTLPRQRTVDDQDGPAGLVPEPDSRLLMAQAGVDLGPWAFAQSASELEAALAELGGRCAVKVVSDQVVHKSDVGGVVLDVTAGDGDAVWDRIHALVTSAVPGAVISGVVVTPMARPGVELLVGATRDPIFGPIVAFGSGGTLVEALQDVSFRAAPFTELEADELIDETIASRLLDGYRHLPPVDRPTLRRFLVQLGDLIAADPRIDELDLNPVIASGTDMQPVDVRVVFGDASPNER